MVIVVEGKHDASLIQSIFKDAFVITTNGSEINETVIQEIKKLSQKEKVYLCLDPDGPGNKIRNKINSEINNVYNVYAEQSKAISKNHKKVGIEHMSRKDILDMFENVYSYNESKKGEFNYSIIYGLGLADSKVKREELCKKLNLGYCNAKQLVKRLNMHGITLEEVKEKI